MVTSIYAGVVADDLDRASDWYAKVFGRPPDARPMGGLLEWHVGDHVLQIVALATVRDIQKLPDWGRSGSSSVTILVDDLDALAGLGDRVSHFEGPAFDTTSYRDPDGNLVTLMELK